MKTLVVIPARGGSKGIPNKNIKLLNGKPLIMYTIELARSLFSDEDICVTTDSLEIKQISESTGLVVPFIRPAILSTDVAGSYEVMLHALDFYNTSGIKYDNLLILQPTSPLRQAKDVQDCISLYNDTLDMVVSVYETDANPYYVLFEEDHLGYLQKAKKGLFDRRQDCPKVWQYNGAIYLVNIDRLKLMPINKFTKVKKYVMPKERSVDIDTLVDWKLTEILLSEINYV